MARCHLCTQLDFSVNHNCPPRSFSNTWSSEILVSDNGPAFSSDEFQQFTCRNGIRHVTSTSYHPASNGSAVRAVQTFKDGIRKITKGDIATRLAQFLFHYRMAPHSTTGIAPEELLFGCKPWSHLDLLHPLLNSCVKANQTHQKMNHDQHSRSRQFDLNDTVYVRNFTKGTKWLPGSITEVSGPLSYTVTLSDN